MDKKLSWGDVEGLVSSLAADIKKSGYKPDVLVGIALGGLVPLALFGKALHTAEVATIAARSYEGKRRGEMRLRSLPRLDMEGKKVLLIDEIADSGETLKKIAQVCKEEYGPVEIKTATLAINSVNCKFKPDFFGMEVDSWLVFPWDAGK